MMLILSFLRSNPFLTKLIVVLVILLGAFFYVKHSESVKDTLRTKLESAKAEFKSLEKTLGEYEDKVESFVGVKNEIEQTKNDSIDSENNLSTELLKTKSFDQETVLKRSRDRARCIELATGAVKVKNETNSICPRFVK